nr:formate dehydrogenase [Neisseria sicca]
MADYSGLTLNRYGVANALMYYPYTAGVAALSHFYFNPL